ncbi:uncharacterized protein LOC142166034 [Nicotiana tabacum]|uniref:Uncharacterized protein LOC142166034 n=2 Tax=Nicotiana TaxID=4085 RepID=A0AC58S6B7_TOBAC
MCAPKATGRLNLINLVIWNKAAITKASWELANKKDKLWIKWIYSYYIKDQSFANMEAPKQASWMRKIFGARGELPKITWKDLMYQNQARPKAIFTMWLLMHERLLTTDRLKKWKVQVDETCCFCNQALETREHIFAECSYGINMWCRLMKWLQIQPIIFSWSEWQN